MLGPIGWAIPLTELVRIVAAVTHYNSICVHASGPWKERNKDDLVCSEFEADVKSCVAGIDFALGVPLCVGEGVLKRFTFVEGSDGRFVCCFG